jgi:mannonate dehydratase
MDRRTFLAAGTALAAPIAGLATEQARPPAAPGAAGRFRAKLGMQDYATDDFLQVYSAFGIEHICSALPSRKLDEKWSVEALLRERERIESFGIHLDMLPLPLSSVEINKAEYPAIMLGKVPERDKAIDEICQMIRNASLAGIPALKYNMSGYDGMMMPDHVPSIPGDPGNYMGGKVSMAFALGYLRALMKTVEAEG